MSSIFPDGEPAAADFESAHRLLDGAGSLAAMGLLPEALEAWTGADRVRHWGGWSRAQQGLPQDEPLALLAARLDGVAVEILDGFDVSLQAQALLSEQFRATAARSAALRWAIAAS